MQGNRMKLGMDMFMNFMRLPCFPMTGVLAASGNMRKI